MSKGNGAYKWGRKRTSERGKVVWLDKSGGKPAPFAQAIPRYAAPGEIPAEYQEHLYVGALWSATAPLAAKPEMAGSKYPILQLVNERFWLPEPELAPIKNKSLMIYAGLIRLEEREANGRIVSVPRHTFVAGAGRYVVVDFNHIKPVT